MVKILLFLGICGIMRTLSEVLYELKKLDSGLNCLNG